MIAPSAFRQAKIASGRGLREPCQILDVFSQTVSLVFNRLLRFVRSGLLFFEPIHLLARSAQPFPIAPAIAQAGPRIGSRRIAIGVSPMYSGGGSMYSKRNDGKRARRGA